MDNDDEALRRLRGADPARGAQPDTWRIRSSVDRDIAGGGGADEVVWEGRTVGRFGRGTAYLVAAAVALLTAGVGGYALSQSRAPDEITPAASSPEDEDSDKNSGRDDADVAVRREELDLSGSMEGAPGDTYGRHPGQEMARQGGAMRLVAGDSISTVSGGKAEVLVQGPPDLEVDAELGSIAERMDISGEATADDMWRSIRQDGRSVSAYTEASGLILSYDNTYLNPGCAQMVREMASLPDAMGPGAGPDLDVDLCLPHPSEPISEPEALAMGRELAADLGVDPESLTFTVYDEPGNETMGSATSTAEDGVRVQLDYTLRAEGVMSAGMVLREDTSMGSYKLISPAEAVERANDPILGRLPIMPDGVPEEEWFSSGQDYVERSPARPGDPIPVPGRQVTATSAKLTTGMLVDGYGSGGVHTVPIYLITTDHDALIAVLALTEDDVALEN